MKTFAFILQIFLSFFIANAQQQTSVDSLKNLIVLAKPDTNKVLLLIQLSNLYTWKPDSCIIFGEQGLTLANSLHYNKGEANLKLNIGTASWILGDYLQADKMFSEALQYAESTHDTVFIINLYTAISSNKRDKKDYRSALDYSFKAYTLCKNCNLFKVKIGSIYLEMNKIDSALFYLQRAPPWGYTLWLLGTAYEKKGDDKTAYQYYLQSISEQIVNGNNLKDLSNTYNSLAQFFKKENKIDSCIYYAKKAYNTANKIYYTKGLWQTALLLSDAYELKDPQQALFYFKIASIEKDSLFNLERTTHFLNEQFNQRWQKQKEEVNAEDYRNKVKTYILLIALGFLLVIAILLYSNNKRKQKAKIKIEQAYSTLKSTQAQLIQSEKMASLGELTAGIAHEIQNPLNFVNNFSEVNKELIEEVKTQKSKLKSEELDELLNDIADNEEKINHHGKRADAIVKSMLQHSKQTKGIKEPTDINALCDEYLRLSYHGMRAKDKNFNAEIKTDFDETIGKINIVPQDIGRVLLNLFNNAFYAVSKPPFPKGEQYKPLVTVTTRKIKLSANDAAKSLPLGTGGLEIIVSDNGSGIPQNIIDKIFQPFFTTKPTGEGTGLGLSLSYDIIKAHGGEIKVESKAGEGSELIITLYRNS